jgi:hypothetical protein
VIIAVVTRGATEVSAQPAAAIDLTQVAKHKPKTKRHQPKPNRRDKHETQSDRAGGFRA